MVDKPPSVTGRKKRRPKGPPKERRLAVESVVDVFRALIWSEAFRRASEVANLAATFASQQDVPKGVKDRYEELMDLGQWYEQLIAGAVLYDKSTPNLRAQLAYNNASNPLLNDLVLAREHIRAASIYERPPQKPSPLTVED